MEVSVETPKKNTVEKKMEVSRRDLFAIEKKGQDDQSSGEKKIISFIYSMQCQLI
jgi:hypothetical protein